MAETRGGGIGYEIPFKPLKESEFNTEKKFLHCNDSCPSAENAFMISKVHDKEMMDILFVNSAIQRLVNFKEFLKTPKFMDIDTEALKKTIHVLEELILFLHKPGTLTDFFEDEGITIQPRQRLLKDFKVIEICTEILYYPFKLNYFKLKSIPEKFRPLFQLCYRLIKHTIKEYRPNEIYSS